jgi:Spy/CpxP family protein refolding chaperone
MAVADVAAVNGGGAATAALGAMAALGATAALGASAVVGDDFNNISMGGGGQCGGRLYLLWDSLALSYFI